MNDLSIVKQQIDAPVFVDKFAYVVSTAFQKSNEDGLGVYQVERLNFLKMLQENTAIPDNVTPASVQGAFLEVVTNGLSFSTTAGLVYLKSRNVKNRAGQYEAKLVYQPTPKGNIYLTEQAGSITNCSEPITVIYSDDFECGTKPDGTKYLQHKKNYPKTDKRIMCVYCWVTFPNGSKEPFWLDEDDMERLKGYSAKDNRKTGEPNRLYSNNGGQPDEGFWKAKVINFALKNKRKKALNNTAFLDNSEEVETVPTEDVTHEEVQDTVPMPDPVEVKAPTGASYNQSNVYPTSGNNYRQPTYNEPAEQAAPVQATAPINDEPF